MEAGNVEMGIEHLQLLQNVVPHLASCAGRKRRYWNRREARAQAAELAIVGAKLMPPLGNTVRLIDGE